MVIKAEKNEDPAEENKIAKEVTIKVLFIKLPGKKRNLLWKSKNKDGWV